MKINFVMLEIFSIPLALYMYNNIKEKGGWKMKKNIKGVVLGLTVMSMMGSLVMPLGNMGVTVKAAEEETTAIETVTKEVAQGKCGDTAEYIYDEKTSTLTVTGTGEMWDDSGFAKAYFGATSIVIEFFSCSTKSCTSTATCNAYLRAIFEDNIYVYSIILPILSRID